MFAALFCVIWLYFVTTKADSSEDFWYSSLDEHSGTCPNDRKNLPKHLLNVLKNRSRKNSFSFKGKDIFLDFEAFYLRWLRHPQDPLLNLHQYKFLLNSDKCETHNPYIMVIIHSAAHDSRRRQLIRTTYGSVKQYNNVKLDFVFVLGETFNSKVNSKLETESRKYNDIIQGNFLDTYTNLLYKHIFAYFWLKKFCPNVEVVVKLDDDVIVNARLIVDYFLNKNKDRMSNGMFICKYREFIDILTPNREPLNKWALSMEEYPYSSFPPYCIGHAYIVSRDLVETILDFTKIVPFLRLDDVYLGFVKWIAGIEMVETEKLIWYFEGNEHNVPCAMFYSIQNDDCVDPKHQHETWNFIWHGVKNDEFCALFGKSWEKFVANIDMV